METSYKEKYEDILARLERAKNDNEVCDERFCCVIDDIIPELAESEDEKIRKTLIKFFSMGAKNNLHTYGIADKDIIAWLEKQAEQKPADTVEPKFKVGDKIYLKPEYRMPDDDTPIANTVKEIRRIDDKHYRFDGSYIFIEDQDKYELVEQKIEENKGNIEGISPKWSVEDEENFCSVYLDVKSARQNTVNSLSGELKEQEQKRMDEVISWLKSLKGRVQPKQEWNEEDEQHIDSLLKRLDALCRNKFERTRFAISEDRDWLKSLRPQNKWKPSDEQIECLSDAIKHYNSLGYPAPKLKELLDDLKELKGEV